MSVARSIRQVISAVRLVRSELAEIGTVAESIRGAAAPVAELGGALGGAADNADRLNAALPVGRWDGKYESSATGPPQGGLAFISGVPGETLTTAQAGGGVTLSTGGRAPGTFGGSGGGSSEGGSFSGRDCGPRPEFGTAAYRNWLLCRRGLSTRQTGNGIDVGIQRDNKAVVEGLNSVKSVLETIANNTRPSRDRGQGNI